MYALLVTVCLAVAAFATPIDHEARRFDFPMNRDIPWGRIVGGQPAKEKQFPYQISLQTKSSNFYHFCSGVIISSRFVLTTASCIQYKYHDTLVYIKAGLLNLNSIEKYEQDLRIEEVYIFQKFDSEEYHDLALIFLNDDLEFNEYVQPISLPEPKANYTGNVIFSGWGSLTQRHEKYDFPNTLHYVELPLVDVQTCQDNLDDVIHDAPELTEETNVCTGPLDGGKGPCVFDHGGPLVQFNEKSKKLELVGVFALGLVPCAKNNEPAVYIKISGYLDWISQTMSQAPKNVHKFH